jgi:hypothetical protein
MSAAAEPACKITRYDCSDPTQKETIDLIAAEADKQQEELRARDPSKRERRSDPYIPPFDPRVLPWAARCSSHTAKVSIRHYIAKKDDGTICGWLLAEKRRRLGYTYIYLAEISAIRYVSPDHRQIGKRLHDTLLTDAKSESVDFIYLYPLTSRVAELYATWGYRRINEIDDVIERGPRYDAVRQQFLILKKTPGRGVLPVKLLNALRPEDSAVLYSSALELAKGDEDLTKILSDNRRDCKASPDCVARLRDALETIQVFADPGDGETLSREEQLDYLRGVFPRTAGGRRKTARNTHRLRFLRKHHLAEHGYSLSELSKTSKVSQPILQQVYDRGIGAYKTNPTSVRMKGTFRKGVKAPYSKKLSKEQWAMARVYSFLDGNPKHDTDLRRKTRRRHK